VSRLVAASLAGARRFRFTTWGATPTRDGGGPVGDDGSRPGRSIYLRYEGNIASQDTTHALTALHMTW